MSIQLHIFRLDRINKAEKFTEVWSCLNNDQFFYFENYYHRATGNRLPLGKEISDETCVSVKEFVTSLKMAVSCINQIFSATGSKAFENSDFNDENSWLTNFEVSAVDTDELKNYPYATSIANTIAGEIRSHVSPFNPFFQKDKLNELIVFNQPQEYSYTLTPETAGQYECNTHRGGCEKCPDCKRLSYCRGCMGCGLCSYPHISISNKEENRFRVTQGWLYYSFEDTENQRIYSPRDVFDRHSTEYRNCILTKAERTKIVEEIGYQNCVAILGHCFHNLGKPYDAEELIKLHL